MGEDATLVLIVDDDQDLRELLHSWLASAGFACREAPDGMAALALAREEHPDVVLLDIVLPGISGYEVCRRLRDEHGDGPSIMFVSGVRIDPLDRATGLMLGADDYMTKPLGADELLARVRRLAARHATGAAQPSASATAASAPPPGPAPSPLTARETEVLALLARGFDGRAIAGELVISTKTVTSHVQRIMAKLGVHNRAQAVARAYADGLLGGSPGVAPVLDLTDAALNRDTSRHAG